MEQSYSKEEILAKIRAKQNHTGINKVKEYRSQTLTAPKDGVFRVVCGGSENTIFVKQGDSITTTWEENV